MVTVRRRISEFLPPLSSPVRSGPLVTLRSLSYQRREALSSSSFEKLKAGFRVNFTVNLFCISANEIFMDLGDGYPMPFAPVSSWMWSGACGELSKQSSKLQDRANSEYEVHATVEKLRKRGEFILCLQVNQQHVGTYRKLKAICWLATLTQKSHERKCEVFRSWGILIWRVSWIKQSVPEHYTCTCNLSPWRSSFISMLLALLTWSWHQQMCCV